MEDCGVQLHWAASFNKEIEDDEDEHDMEKHTSNLELASSLPGESWHIVGNKIVFYQDGL